MTNRPASVIAALILILLNALIWLALGLIIALHIHPALPASPLIQAGMAILSIGAAGVLVGLFFLLRIRFRLAWIVAVGFLAVTSLLNIFDDFGWTDLVVVVINILPLVLIIKDRAWYTRAKPAAVLSPPTRRGVKRVHS